MRLRKVKRRWSQSSIAALLILVILPSAIAQPTAPLSPAAQKISDQLRDFPLGGRVTINLYKGEELYGNIKSIPSDSLTIHEADRDNDRTVRFEDVRQVRKDYGRRGFNGKRIHPHRRPITTVIFVGVLLGVVIGLLASDKT